MIDKVYYLNWDRETEFDQDASTLFHQASISDLPGEIPAKKFDDMYREVRELDNEVEDLEQLWSEWNRGSGTESQEFLSTRYCHPCEDEQFGSMDDAYHHFFHEHYQPPQNELEDFFQVIRGVRSMSVGDAVYASGDYFMAAPVGWQKFQVTGDE